MATKKVPDTQAPANTPESFAAVREVFGKHPVDVIDPIEWGVEATPPQLLLCDKIFRVRFQPDSQLLLRFLAEAMKLRTVREHIESRLTGTSPTMKNISKPALLDIRFPLPDLATQQTIVDDIGASRTIAATKRNAAATLRQSAWATFEAALFTATEEPAP